MWHRIDNGHSTLRVLLLFFCWKCCLRLSVIFLVCADRLIAMRFTNAKHSRNIYVYIQVAPIFLILSLCAPDSAVAHQKYYFCSIQKNCLDFIVVSVQSVPRFLMVRLFIYSSCCCFYRCRIFIVNFMSRLLLLLWVSTVVHTLSCITDVIYCCLMEGISAM